MLTKYGFKTTKERSRLMSKIKGKETNAEIILRKGLWRLGYRYRKNYKKLVGKPDIVFVKQKLVIFIDGEFWHGYNWEEKKGKIKSNSEYWIKKIERNMQRDQEATKCLESEGWKVIRFWEQEIKKQPENCINLIAENLLQKNS